MQGDDTPVLSLNTASKDKMTNKAIYFVRSNPKGVTAGAIEQDMCYGEIPKDPLADFDFILGQVTQHHGRLRAGSGH